MFKSCWIIAVAFGLVATLGAAQDQPATENQPSQNETSADGQGNRDEDQAQPVDLTPALESIESAIRDLESEVDEVEQNLQREANQRELEAQEGMAHWTELMFYAAFASTFLTALALWAIVRTLHQTRRAADYTEGMLKEAEKATKGTFGAVDAAKDANVASAKAVKIDQRPWVSVDIVEFQHVKVDTGPNCPRLGSRHFSAIVILRIINTGKTPAQAVEIWVDAFREEELKGTLKTIVLKESEGDKHRLIGVIPPNSETTLDFPITRSFVDFPDLEDFEFQCRLLCSIRYSTDASLRDNHDGHTLQTFVIENDDGDRRSIWIDTRDIRLSRTKLKARPAVGQMN